MAIESTGVTCDQFLIPVDAQAIWIGFYRQTSSGKARRNRIAVALEGHPKLAISAQRKHPRTGPGSRLSRLQQSSPRCCRLVRIDSHYPSLINGLSIITAGMAVALSSQDRAGPLPGRTEPDMHNLTFQPGHNHA